jgi:hypothetical protein
MMEGSIESTSGLREPFLSPKRRGPVIVLLGGDGSSASTIAEQPGSDRGEDTAGLVVAADSSPQLRRRRDEEQQTPSNSSSLNVSQTDQEETNNGVRSDLRFVLVLGQWIWPLLVWTVLIYDFSLWEAWMVSILGNSLMVAILWYDAEGSVLRRSQVIPTLIWAFLPYLAILFIESPDLMFILVLTLVIPFFLLLVVRYKTQVFYTIASRVGACFFMDAIDSLSLLLNIFKRMEEDYFEDQRTQEDEENRKLELQQERLRHLNDSAVVISKGRICPPLAVALVLIAVYSVCFNFLLYYRATLPEGEPLSAISELVLREAM